MLLDGPKSLLDYISWTGPVPDPSARSISLHPRAWGAPAPFTGMSPVSPTCVTEGVHPTWDGPPARSAAATCASSWSLKIVAGAGSGSTADGSMHERIGVW